jgi:MoaA/NifB/PqqE/SkfB family radical SAM enzyme
MWSFFFLVPVGRGKVDDLLTGQEFEDVFAKMWDLTKRVPFAIKTTEAMHYRRYLIQQRMKENRPTTGVHDDAGARPTSPPRLDRHLRPSRPGLRSESRRLGHQARQ